MSECTCDGCPKCKTAIGNGGPVAIGRDMAGQKHYACPCGWSGPSHHLTQVPLPPTRSEREQMAREAIGWPVDFSRGMVP